MSKTRLTKKQEVKRLFAERSSGVSPASAASGHQWTNGRTGPVSIGQSDVALREVLRQYLKCKRYAVG